MALVALGVTGGIGAYKSVEIARSLQQLGHDVVAIMTESAIRFVGPLTFEAITRRKVITDQFAEGANADIEHIAIASDIDLLLIAPATANTIGKLANGLADNFLSSLYLATTAPVMVAPAMNTNMLSNAAVENNLKMLALRGVRVVEPGDGYLACGWVGKGRLAEPGKIVSAAEELLNPKGGLVGRCLLITAGPTCEDLDPVRYLGNRSTGRMGFAVAAEAMNRGARVILIVGPTELAAPAGAEVRKVRSANQMHQAVSEEVDKADAVVMAAAVADYMPKEEIGSEKVSKSEDDISISLQRTPDILAELGGRRSKNQYPVLVGFAAETSELLKRATAKLKKKNVDIIVANDVSRSDTGFGVETNAALIVSSNHGGEVVVDEISLGPKRALACEIIDRVEQRLSVLSNVTPQVVSDS